MFKIIVYTGKEELANIELKTEQRNLARAIKMLCNENKLNCTVEVEVPASTREVKFKNVD